MPDAPLPDQPAAEPEAPKPDSLAQRAETRQSNLAKIEEAIVRIDEMTGMKAIVITPELRQNFNVLSPASVFQQENPDIAPQVAIVPLEAEDYYVIDKAKAASGDWPATPANLAPRKEGLGKLAEARGISFPSALNHGAFGAREEFTVRYGEHSRVVRFRVYDYHATGVTRGPDGTLLEKTVEVSFDPEVALLEAELDLERRVKNWKKKPSSEEMFTMLLERFKELAKYAAPMIKSKAQNGVIRDITHAPQKIAETEAFKPFLFVSYTFASNSDESRRALMQSVFGVSSPQEALYGATAPAAALESAPADVEPVEQAPEDAEVPEVLDEPSEPESESGDEVEGEWSEVESESQGTIVANTETGECPTAVVPQGFSAGGIEPPQPPAPPATGHPLSDDERAQYQHLLGYVLPATNYQGKTLGDVKKGEGDQWKDWFDKAIAYGKSQAFTDPRAVEMFQNIGEFFSLADKAGE